MPGTSPPPARGAHRGIRGLADAPAFAKKPSRWNRPYAHARARAPRPAAHATPPADGYHRAYQAWTQELDEETLSAGVQVLSSASANRPSAVAIRDQDDGKTVPAVTRSPEAQLVAGLLRSVTSYFELAFFETQRPKAFAFEP